MNNDGRRHLDPLHTTRYVHIPHLREKLEWLYGFHPLIKSQERLAHELDVSPATLSTWLNGKRYSDVSTVATVNPDSIPTKRFREFINIWAIPDAVIELPDLIEFKNALATLEASHGPWERLVRSLPDDQNIEFIVNRTRGIVDPDGEHDPGTPHFHIRDEVAFRVANPGFRHGVLLLQDRLGWVTLRPSSRWPETKIGDVLTFPQAAANGSTRFAALDLVGGFHRVLVIFVQQSLPAGVIDILSAHPMMPSSLNYIVAALQGMLAEGPKKCCMLSRRFFVSSTER